MPKMETEVLISIGLLVQVPNETVILIINR